MDERNGTAHEWSAVASAWDTCVDEVDLHSSEATEALLDRAAVTPGDRVLELTAGPGSLGGEWSRRVGPHGSVLLSDIAPGMVEVAARRNAEHGNVSVAVLDAAAIDRPDGSFDVVASRMGLMFVPEPGRAFAEIRRVLSPGGRFAAQTWGGLEHNPWMTCVGMAAMIHGLLTDGPPVGPGSIFSLADPVGLEALAAAAGFGEVAVEELTVVFRAPDVETHVERVAALAGPLALALRDAPPDVAAAVRHTAAELAAPYASPDGVAIPGRVLMVSGRATDRAA